MKIEINSKATERAAISEIKKALGAILQGDVALRISITEGREECGYGQLRVSGTVTVDRSCLDGGNFIRDTYLISQTRNSQWRNFGRPSGTRYALSAELTFAKSEKMTYAR